MHTWGNYKEVERLAEEIIGRAKIQEVERINFTTTLDKPDYRRLSFILEKLDMSKVAFCERAIMNLVNAVEAELNLYDPESPTESDHFKAVNLLSDEDFEKYLADVSEGEAAGRESYVYRDGEIVEG